MGLILTSIDGFCSAFRFTEEDLLGKPLEKSLQQAILEENLLRIGEKRGAEEAPTSEADLTLMENLRLLTSDPLPPPPSLPRPPVINVLPVKRKPKASE